MLPVDSFCAVCRDGGNLMYQQQAGRNVHVRATELVIGFLASLGNYAYGFNWVFREDGSFAFEVELSGAISTRLVRDQTCGACAAAGEKLRGHDLMGAFSGGNRGARRPGDW